MSDVSIIDYDSGNIASVRRAFERCGASVRIVTMAQEVASASRLVLPGVGAFAHCAELLRQRGLWDAVKDFAKSGRPFLGICVGMQLLFEVSEEFGTHEGFGLIPGHVKAIARQNADGSPRKVPHIGWNKLLPVEGEAWSRTLLDQVIAGSAVYFVHSFVGAPEDRAHTLAETDYGGTKLCAAVRVGNAYGCQFHPEKSGPVGLSIISNFVALPTAIPTP
jgi:glutamine amidotransferase